MTIIVLHVQEESISATCVTSLHMNFKLRYITADDADDTVLLAEGPMDLQALLTAVNEKGNHMVWKRTQSKPNQW